MPVQQSLTIARQLHQLFGHASGQQHLKVFAITVRLLQHCSQILLHLYALKIIMKCHAWNQQVQDHTSVKGLHGHPAMLWCASHETTSLEFNIAIDTNTYGVLCCTMNAMMPASALKLWACSFTAFFCPT